MRGRASAAEITKLIGDLNLATTRVAGLVSKARRKVALDTERDWKIAMPVDTGRARASVGHWTPGDLRDVNEAATVSDAHFVEGDTFTEVGTNVAYVEELNAGTSKKAPAGFIDAIWVAQEKVLEAAVDAIVEKAALGQV